MKFWILAILFLISSCLPKEKKRDPVSYSKGYHFWKSISEDASYPYDVEELIEGILAASSGNNLEITEGEVHKLLDLYEESKRHNDRVAMEEILNSPPSDWIEIIPSKLYYKIEKTGDQISPPFETSINVSYGLSIYEEGLFHKVYSTEVPIKISLDQTVSGFSLGICGMKIGEKRTIYMHPDLADGSYPEFQDKLIAIDVYRE